MKAPHLFGLVLSACCVGTFAAPSRALALDFDKLNPMNVFKKAPDKSAPTDEEKRVQENAAAAMWQDAKSAMASGNKKKATDLYKEIVHKYPYSDTAAEAQFALAWLLREDGKLTESFDAYQKLIDKYRKSARFSVAIEQQYEIAEEAKSGKKEGTLIHIPMKIDTSEVIKMYQAILKSAPYGKFGPLAQFSIGELYQDKGEKDNAVTAYQAVVDNYSNSKQAAEAQFRIGSIASIAARHTQNGENLVTARDALDIYRLNHPEGERIGEADALKNQTTQVGSERSLDIAKFYEHSGKPKAAAIYYNDAAKGGSPDTAGKARERLAALAAKHGEELKATPDQDESDSLVPAPTNLKARNEYAGPPGPELAKADRTKPKMRTDDENFKPLPIKEPELPTKPNSAPLAPGSLLPPATPPGVSDKPTLLPVPPAPSAAPGLLPVPPKPDDIPKPN